MVDYPLNNPDIRSFVLAGNAVLTLESGKTGTRYTYRVRKHKTEDIWFLSMLTGSDNTGDYQYIGWFKADLKLLTSREGKPLTSTPMVAFNCLLQGIRGGPWYKDLGVYHACKCGRCGRQLTTPESIKRGIGPECIKAVA